MFLGWKFIFPEVPQWGRWSLVHAAINSASFGDNFMKFNELLANNSYNLIDKIVLKSLTVILKFVYVADSMYLS